MDYGGQADTPATWRSDKTRTDGVRSGGIFARREPNNQSPSLSQYPGIVSCSRMGGRGDSLFDESRDQFAARDFPKRGRVPLQFVPLAFVIDDTTVVIQRWDTCRNILFVADTFVFTFDKFRKKRITKSKKVIYGSRVNEE